MTDYTVQFSPLNRKAVVKKGTTILEAAGAAGITLNNLCAGQGICGRCKMRLKEGNISGNYQIGLDVAEIQENIILSCLANVESDLYIEIPEKTLTFCGTHKLKTGLEITPAEIWVKDYSPLINKVYLQVDKPTLVNNLSDQQRIENALKKSNQHNKVSWDLSVLKTLPYFLRGSEDKLTCVYAQYKDRLDILSMEKGNNEKAVFLIAVDIGTTTLKAQLLRIDKKSAKVMAQVSCRNSQSVYGRDVTSRIITGEKKGITVLQELIVRDINTLIHELLNKSAKTPCSGVFALVCSGNTVMMHFLLGLPAAHIRRSPYVPVTVKPPPVPASELGINIRDNAHVYWVPGISGWVGGDIGAGILATGMHKSEELCLLVDIGTNGEIVLGNKDWLVACSASAGPALEGASEACGMQATAGAIEKVWTEKGEIKFKTIADHPVAGICGSGIIDLVSVMLELGIIDRSGRFAAEMKPQYRKRMRNIQNRDSFVLFESKDGKRVVFITEPDIEHIISAKAAIFAAIKILIQRFDFNFGDIKHLFLAGSFGNYLNTKSAVNIGLIPAIRPAAVHFVGNTSLQGAGLAALSAEARTTLQHITDSTTYFDLMGENDYVEEYKKALFLPHTDLELFA